MLQGIPTMDVGSMASLPMGSSTEPPTPFYSLIGLGVRHVKLIIGTECFVRSTQCEKAFLASTM